MKPATVAVSALLTITLVPASAAAFRTLAEELDVGGPVRWASATLEIELSEDVPSSLELAAVERDVLEAAAVWSEPACSSISLPRVSVSDAGAEPLDGRNTVEWVTDWEARGFGGDQPAMTDVQVEEAGDGWRIVEADIYLNAEHFDWTTDAARGEEQRVRDVLVHELGHFIGLEHPCEVGSDGDAPDCESASESVALSVMHPEATALESLAEDDAAGVCSLYPDEAPSDTPEVAQDPDEPELPIVSTSVPDCESAHCQGPGPRGDPCAQHDDCKSGICAPEGFCAARCQSGGDCDPGARCVAAGGERLCETALEPFAGECDNADDCLGGECISWNGGPRQCSRSCDEAQPCPSGWDCVTEAGRSVCAPPPEVSEGCSCRLASPSRDARGGLLTLLLGIWVTTRMGRDRRGRHSGDER